MVETLASPRARLEAWGQLWGQPSDPTEVQLSFQLRRDLCSQGVLAPLDTSPSCDVLRFAAWMLTVGDVLDVGKGRQFYRWLRDLSAPLALEPPAMRLVAAVVGTVDASRPGYVQEDIKSLSEGDRRLIEQLAGILRLSHGLERRLNGALTGFVVEPSPDDSIVLAACLDDPSVPFGPKLRHQKDLLQAACGRPVVLYPHVTTRMTERG